jgi:hypothetical protein
MKPLPCTHAIISPSRRRCQILNSPRHAGWAQRASIGDRDNLRLEIEKVAATHVQPRAYVHRLPTALLMAAQRVRRGMTREDQIRWRRWITKQGRCVTDPARTAGDPGPAVAEFLLQFFSFLQHPRSYLRGLWKLP